MTVKARIYLLLVGALLLLVAVLFGIRQYRIGRTAAFCRAVGEMPPAELARFADRCDQLMWERGGPGAGLEFIRDDKTLARFTLVGTTPYEIVVEKGHVGLKYHKGHWSYSDLLFWGEDYAQDGECIRVLKIAYGSGGFRVLAQREGGHGERADKANRGQSFSPDTNRTAADSSRRSR